MKTHPDPLKLETSHFKPNLIVFQQRGFVVAVGIDKKSGERSLACRWHNEGTGYPSSRGYPQWMFLPEGTDWSKMDKPLSPNSISLTLRGDTLLPKEGDWILDDLGSWHLVSYCYMDNVVLSCIGLGKSGSYPITVDCVRKVNRNYTSVLSKWHKSHLCVWTDKHGMFYASFPTYFDEDKDKHGNVFSIVDVQITNSFVCMKNEPERNYVVQNKAETLGYTYQLTDMFLLYKGPFEGSPFDKTFEVLDAFRLRTAPVEFKPRNFLSEVIAEEANRTQDSENPVQESFKPYDDTVDIAFSDAGYIDCIDSPIK